MCLIYILFFSNSIFPSITQKSSHLNSVGNWCIPFLHFVLFFTLQITFLFLIIFFLHFYFSSSLFISFSLNIVKLFSACFFLHHFILFSLYRYYFYRHYLLMYDLFNFTFTDFFSYSDFLVDSSHSFKYQQRHFSPFYFTYLFFF